MIINIESFNISNRLLYSLINKINPSRFRRAAAHLALLAVLVLPGCSLLEPAKEPPKPANPTGVSGKYNPQAEQLFGKARVLWKNGETCSDPEAALDSLDEALKLEPDYPQALIRRGLALSQLGYADDAFDDLTRAIRLEPSAEAYLSRAICLLQQGNTVGAAQGPRRVPAPRRRLVSGMEHSRSRRPQGRQGSGSLRRLREGLLERRLHRHRRGAAGKTLQVAARSGLSAAHPVRFTLPIKPGRESGKERPSPGHARPGPTHRTIEVLECLRTVPTARCTFPC